MNKTSYPVPSSHTVTTASNGHSASFDELMGMLQYNQGLVEFADSKAGSLILLNSLLIAAVSALPNQGNMGLFKLASVLVASAAVFLCFQVISSTAGVPPGAGSALVRKPGGNGWQAHDFVFFDCINAHKSGDHYSDAFHGSPCESRRRSLLQRTFIVAGIAKRKFSQYALAQKVTTIAMAVWVTVNVLPFLGV